MFPKKQIRLPKSGGEGGARESGDAHKPENGPKRTADYIADAPGEDFQFGRAYPGAPSKRTVLRSAQVNAGIYLR